MGAILLDAQSTPGTPPAGKSYLWVDATTKKLVTTDDAATRHGMLSKNANTVTQTLNATSVDTYITNSGLLIPSFALEAGMHMRWWLGANKTATGTTSAIFTIRIGPNQSTADTARVTVTMTAQSAVADVGLFIIDCLVRLGGAAGTLAADVNLMHQTSGTGFGSGAAGTSAAFDMTTIAGQFVGLSLNAQAGVWNLIKIYAELVA